MKKTHAVQWGLICWLTYLSAYLCRVNFSSSLTALAVATGVDYSLLGTAGAAFFGVYAVGQLINGFIGDHINPVAFILTALGGTVVCNLGVALFDSFAMIFLLWALNGYFQSIFWSTIIRVLAMTVSQERRGNASAVISSAMPAGYLVSWCVLTPCFTNANVKWSFLTPALIALPMMALWLSNRHVLPQNASPRQMKAGLRKDMFALIRLICTDYMAVLLAVCILHGLIKEGVGFWFPTIIHEVSDSMVSLTAGLALFPLANFLGTVTAKRLLVPFAKRPKIIVRGCFAAMAPLCVGVMLAKGMWVLIPMCMISALSYCANTVLMSYIPMQYLSKGFVSSLVGVLDFCSYLGAAIATYVLGGMLETSGMRGISLVWLVASCAAMLMLLLQPREESAE